MPAPTNPLHPPVQRAAAAHAPVSVVVPCYRCTATIDEAVASVAAQSLRPAEVLLVEDGSGDDTLAALYRVAAAYEAGWIKIVPLAVNGGPSRARNEGWDRAEQPYVAFLDADDTWGPRKLEWQMAVLEADPSIALIAHRMLIRPRGTPVPEARTAPRTRTIGRFTLLVRNPFPTASVVLRRDLPFRFDNAMRCSEDYLLWSQIVFSGYRCARVEQVLAIWNRRAPGVSGLSSDVPEVHRTRREVRRKLLREGLISWPEYVFARTVGALVRIRRDLKRRQYARRQRRKL